MISDPIAFRKLIFRNTENKELPFIIYVGKPICIDGDHICEIYSQDIIFRGIKKISGIDAIDCLDYAIQMIDLLSMEFEQGTLLHSDGTQYIRETTKRKMDWAFPSTDGKRGADSV